MVKGADAAVWCSSLPHKVAGFIYYKNKMCVLFSPNEPPSHHEKHLPLANGS